MAIGGPCGAREKEKDWLAELNGMEVQADQARNAFWRGHYAEAESQFKALSESTHPSVILYLNERGMCSLAEGDYPEAERLFRQTDSLLATYHSEAREKRAASAFGAEAEKIYRGDPYEQSMAYLLLALVLMDKGDYDNALAACKSGILADSDASENLFDSDISLLHAIEAKCHLLRGEEEAFRACRDGAAKSVRVTSAQIREAFSKRQDLLAMLKMPPPERKRLGEKRTNEQISAEIQTLTAQLDQQAESIDAVKSLGPLFSGDYNVLFLVPRGRCVTKMRAGADAETIVFREYASPSQDPDLNLNGHPLSPDAVLADAFDVDFQATTRGGRRMDAILKGKAVSRATTLQAGKTMMDVANNVPGFAGLGIALVAGVVQGTAGAMTPEADTRCWQTLPRQFQICALKLPSGHHRVTGSHYLYFQRLGGIDRTIVIESEQDTAVVIMPPPPYGLYFSREETRLSQRDREGFGASSTMLITPPTGLDDIVRVSVDSAGDKPEAIAPDSKRMMRSIQKALVAKKVTAALVSHSEVVQSRAQLADQHRLALQCGLVEMKREGTQKAGTYRTRLAFCVVETKTGEVLLNKTLEATCADLKNGPSAAFYACVEQATQDFAGSPDFNAIDSAKSI